MTGEELEIYIAGIRAGFDLKKEEKEVIIKPRRGRKSGSKNKKEIIHWTKEEEDFLRKNSTKMSSREISQHINRTMRAIDLRREKLGLKSRKYQKDPYEGLAHLNQKLED